MSLIKSSIKNIIKYSFYFLILLIVFILFELISLDNTYVNKPSFSIDVNNVRNPQIKKIVRKLDNSFGQVYFALSSSKQKEFFENNRNYYNNLPNEILVKAKLDNLTISNGLNKNNEKNWKRSHGNHSSNKFSNLNQINKQNVNSLEVVWTHTFEKKKDVAGNPIYYNGTIFLSSTGKSLVALNASDGKKNGNLKLKVWLLEED